MKEKLNSQASKGGTKHFSDFTEVKLVPYGSLCLGNYLNKFLLKDTFNINEQDRRYSDPKARYG